jgi:hypothetical protein
MDDQEKFKEDMLEAGYVVDEDYGGRNYYRGYAVRCSREEEQDVIRATTVRLQSDSMGLGMILYPTKSRRKKDYANV